ncbi:hypothetical protein C7421_10614 [Pantoea ananatis]|nr:hypothetical protein C7421_10614 [Pantoea ananatis]REC91314.1 hypothetical protein C7423_104294 [Pantoea ananatis]
MLSPCHVIIVTQLPLAEQEVLLGMYQELPVPHYMKTTQ